LEACVQRARSWQMERPLFGALHLTTAMFPGAKTPAVSRAKGGLLDRPTRQCLVAQVLPDPTSEPSGWGPGRRRIQLRRKFALIDRPWRRAAFIAYFIFATGVGLAFEWHARRRGLNIPSRTMLKPR